MTRPSAGTVRGPPAPVFWTWGHERENALARLQNMFRVGGQGRVFRDFVGADRRLGKGDAEIMAEWRVCKQAVVWAAQRGI